MPRSSDDPDNEPTTTIAERDDARPAVLAGDALDEAAGSAAATFRAGPATVLLQRVRSATGTRVDTRVFLEGQSGPVAQFRGQITEKQAQEAGIPEDARREVNELIDRMTEAGEVSPALFETGADRVQSLEALAKRLGVDLDALR